MKDITNLKNVKFKDLLKYLEENNFEFKRQKGSHMVFAHKEFPEEIVNIQNRKGEAKPYQIRDVLKTLERIKEKQK